MISESTTTQFSLTIFESTGTLCAHESKRHLLKRFLWWFLRRQWLNFCWLFLSQQGLYALTNPHVPSRSNFDDDLWVISDSVFIDYFWVNMGSVCLRIHVSHVEAVSLMISDSTTIQFSLTIYDSTGDVCGHESRRHLWKYFHWWFLSLQVLCTLPNPRVTFGNFFVDLVFV
jgi:hypothetical protein